MRTKTFRRGEAILKVDEIQTLAYSAVLVGTLVYGIIAMNSRYELIERRERARYRTGIPPKQVEGVILMIVDQSRASDLSTNWKIWTHKIRIDLNKTEILFITDPNFTWYAIGPIFHQTSCKIPNISSICMLEDGLRTAVSTFPNFKWLIKAPSSAFINEYGLSNLIQSLPTNYHRTKILKSGIKQSGKLIHLDSRSGWFLSRRAVLDWIEKMPLFRTEVQNHGGSISKATASIPEILDIPIKSIIDPRFVPHTKTMDEFSELIDIGANECPKQFRYFGFIQMNTTQIRDCVTWNLNLDQDERKVAMMQIPRSPASYGYITAINGTELCSIPKWKPSRRERKAKGSK